MRHIRRHNVFLALATAALGACLVGGWLLATGLPTPEELAALADAPSPSILITDRDGRLLYELIRPDAGKHLPVPLSEIPLSCRQATLATEDAHFYSHPGVDLVAILRAAWQNLRAGQTVSGASTLTQQVARNLYLPRAERAERSLRRKLREAWLAWRLERAYSKDELLALYLNTTYYGHFATGIEAAAQAYFGVRARDLDLAQCALLAGLPQNPAGYNPLENPQAAQRRQAVVLGRMAAEGYISPKEAAQAARERLALAATPFPIEAPHFVMWVQGQLEQLLSPEVLRAGGLRVTTTLDLDLQREAEEIVRRRLAQRRPCTGDALPPACDPSADPSRRVENAALVALDPHTGAILAMVGSPNYFDARIAGAVNAALSPRQPGSAIKPLTYAAALDPERAARAGQRPWTAATLIADVRTVFPTAEGDPYIPENYDRVYHGPVTVREALANSYNIPAVKALQFVGVDALIELARGLGIPWTPGAAPAGTATPGEEADLPTNAPDVPPGGFGLALTLGGGEVRLLDLTAAYAAFANGGQRVVPYGTGRVEPLVGEGIGDGGLEIADQNPQSPIPNIQHPLDPRVAFLITDILSDETARVPAFGPDNLLEIGRPAAAKTGTSSDWRDNWTVGYTPDLVVGVWVGNADGSPMRDVSGITGAAPIWHDFMVAALRNTPPREFVRPEGLVRLEICADSGLLPADRGSQIEDRRFISEGTTLTIPSGSAGGSIPQPAVVPCPARRLEWFIEGTEPTQMDISHRRVAIDVRSGQSATKSTPLAEVAYTTIWLLPAELQGWARERGIPQPGAAGEGTLGWSTSAGASPPALAGSRSVPLSLASPEPRRTYRLDPLLPADSQRVPITARLGPELLPGEPPVTLLLDGVPFSTVSAPDYTAWWPITPGRHVWQAVARAADGNQVASEEVFVLVE